MSAGLPPNSLFSALTFVGFLLAAIPLPWHVHPWHAGAFMFMVWTSLGCLISFINSIVWNDNVSNSAPVWCDISARYLVGANVGVPASSLCIIRRLYHITRLRTVSVEKDEKRRLLVDIAIGIGLPCIAMALQYVVQGHRFAIIEQIGCYPIMNNTLPAYFLGGAWPLVIGLISLVYAVLTFRWARRQKEELKKMLQAGFFISTGRYWRLMALCSVEIALTTPISTYGVVTNAISGVEPYVSWASIHSDFSHIIQLPDDVWQSMPSARRGVETTRWWFILCAFVIFAFFGWPQEAREFYCQAFCSIRRRFGNSKVSSPPLTTTPPRDTNQHGITSKRLSMPLRFEVPTSSESLWDDSQLNADEELVEGPPRLRPLSNLSYLAKISWQSLIAVPEPALSRDRRSVQDIHQLV